MKEYLKLWVHGFLLSIVMGIVLFISGLFGVGLLAILSLGTSTLSSALLGGLLWLIINIAIVPFVYGYVSRVLSEWLHK